MALVLPSPTCLCRDPSSHDPRLRGAGRRARRADPRRGGIGQIAASRFGAHPRRARAAPFPSRGWSATTAFTSRPRMAGCWCGRHATLAGLIEVRGLGIRRLPYRAGRGRRPGRRPRRRRCGAPSGARNPPLRKSPGSPCRDLRSRPATDPLPALVCCAAHCKIPATNATFRARLPRCKIYLPDARHPLALAPHMVMMAPFRAVGRKRAGRSSDLHNDRSWFSLPTGGLPSNSARPWSTWSVRKSRSKPSRSVRMTMSSSVAKTSSKR